MTDPFDKHSADDELAEFRRQAAALGFETPAEDELDYSDLETSDEFITRMKRDEVARKRWRRRIAAGLATAAAFVGVWVAVDRPVVAPAVADTPPVLDYEFAAAVRIAFAKGEQPDDILDLLAEAADSSDDPPANGDIQYKKSENWFLDIDDDGTTRIIPREVESWLAPDGTLATSERPGRPLTSDGRGIEDDDDQPADSTDVLPAGSVESDFAANLSSDPKRLINQLLDHIECEDREPGPIRSMCLYDEITALFQSHVVPSSVAAAIWTALKDEQGFTALGSVEDRAGRPAVGLSISDPSSPQFRYILIVSPEDGQLTGVEEILVKTDETLDADPPAVIAFTTYLRSEYVERMPAK